MSCYWCCFSPSLPSARWGAPRGGSRCGWAASGGRSQWCPQGILACPHHAPSAPWASSWLSAPPHPDQRTGREGGRDASKDTRYVIILYNLWWEEAITTTHLGSISCLRPPDSHPRIDMGRWVVCTFFLFNFLKSLKSNEGKIHPPASELKCKSN